MCVTKRTSPGQARTGNSGPAPPHHTTLRTRTLYAYLCVYFRPAPRAHLHVFSLLA